VERCSDRADGVRLNALRVVGTADSFFGMAPQAEAKASLKARVESELAVAADDAALSELRAKFAAEERNIEHKIDHEVHTFSASLDVTYNFLSK